MLNKTLAFFLISFLSLTASAQNCNNSMYDGQELQIDCGGPDCLECIPLLYSITCDDEDNGTFFVNFTLPDYWQSIPEYQAGYRYAMTGDYNQDNCLLFGACGSPNLPFSDGSYIDIKVRKYLEMGNQQEDVAYGVIQGFLSCVKLDTNAVTCPPETVFEYTQDTVDLGNGNYMLKFNMEGGTPPYNVYDNERQLFYVTGWNQNNYHVGAIPDTIALDLIVSDLNGCLATKKNDDITAIGKIDLREQGIEFDAYPSFHNDFIQLEVVLPEATDIQITAHSLNGQLIERIVVNERLSAGTHQIPVQTSNFPSGIYMYNLTVQKGNASVKVIKE